MSCGERKTKLRMSKNDEDIDLRLALGSRNYSTETRLESSSDAGAGVNANLRVDMPFTVSDPLSELVWSPHNGLSLKCANSSLADNRPFLTWRDSAHEILTSRDIRLGGGGGDNKAFPGEKLSVSQSQTMLDEAGNSGDKTALFRSSGGSSSYGGSKGLIDKAITADAIQEEIHKGNVHIASIAESSKVNTEIHTLRDAARDRKSETATNWKFPRNLFRGRHVNHKGRFETNASRSGVVGLAVPIRSEPPTAKVSEARVCSLPNLQAHYQIDDEVTSASSDVHKTKPDASPTLMNVESSAENDLGRLVVNEAPSLVETRLPTEDSLPVDVATSSRICLYREKGKEKAKASSDGDIYGRSSNDRDDDSHETVGSCNSARLGVKRQHYDREHEIGSKRMKNCIQESPGSTSVIKADSSFMKWISNMVKGLTDSNKEEPSVLALTLAHSNNVCSYNHQESSVCNKTTEVAKPRTGFQNVFQSLYCQTNKTPISEVKNDNQFVEESHELMVADKKPLDITPQSCNSNNDSSCKQIACSDQEANPNVSTRPIKPWMFSADFLARYSSDKSLPENKALDAPENPTGSSCKRADITAEKMDVDTPFPMNCVPEKSRPLPSLWITRLYTNTAQFDNRNSERLEANHESWENDVSSIGKKTTEGKDDCGRDQTRASESVDLRFSDKQSPLQPFHESRSSEAMASVFARRLDALKHIIHPSERRCSPTFPVTCFYCGCIGHDLRKCAQLTETELEDLLVNISSFNRVDKSPCLCIRCFQLDHWAISCPSASSQENRRSKQNAGAVERQSTCHLQPSADDHKNKFSVEVDCSRKPASGSFPNFLAWNMKGSSSKRFSTSNEFQKSALSNSGNHLKEKQVFPPCIAVPQEEMFHIIRRLRLSRSDILRWMDSDVSLSHLNGFFLRLRLGKVEGGLEGTGYYVACITGDSIENIGCKSKKSVLVDVGGLKSSVGSQYISNHDFLEEEIKGWWSRIVKNGGKIPSIDELKSKYESRECLGL